MNPLAEALDGEQARECVDAFLQAIDRHDETGDTRALLQDLLRVVQAVEQGAYTIKPKHIKPRSWPREAIHRAMELRASGLGRYQTAQQIAAEFDRPCRHSLIRHWEAA